LEKGEKEEVEEKGMDKKEKEMEKVKVKEKEKGAEEEDWSNEGYSTELPSDRAELKEKGKGKEKVKGKGKEKGKRTLRPKVEMEYMGEELKESEKEKEKEEENKEEKKVKKRKEKEVKKEEAYVDNGYQFTYSDMKDEKVEKEKKNMPSSLPPPPPPSSYSPPPSFEENEHKQTISFATSSSKDEKLLLYGMTLSDEASDEQKPSSDVPFKEIVTVDLPPALSDPTLSSSNYIPFSEKSSDSYISKSSEYEADYGGKETEDEKGGGEGKRNSKPQPASAPMKVTAPQIGGAANDPAEGISAIIQSMQKNLN